MSYGAYPPPGAYPPAPGTQSYPAGAPTYPQAGAYPPTAPGYGGGYPQGPPPQQWGAPPPQQWGAPPQQQQQWGAPPQQWGTPPAGGPSVPYNQGAAPPPGGPWGAPPPPQWGQQPGYGAPPPGVAGWSAPPPPQNLTWSDPIEQDAPFCGGDQMEIKKVIAREYNISPASAGDQISSGNIEIINVQPSGDDKARVTFRVNDGQFPPDPQERGVLKWVIAGGIAAFAAYKINESRRRKGHSNIGFLR